MNPEGGDTVGHICKIFVEATIWQIAEDVTKDGARKISNDDCGHQARADSQAR